MYNMHLRKLLEVSLMAHMVKNLPPMGETRVQSLGQEDPLEKEMATHYSVLAWRIPGMVEPGWLPSMGSHRVEHDWSDLAVAAAAESTIQVYLTVILKKSIAFSEKWKWSHSVVSDPLRPHGLQPTRLLPPWDSPGKSIGMGCHFLLQGIFLTQGLNPGLLHSRQTL